MLFYCIYKFKINIVLSSTMERVDKQFDIFVKVNELQKEPVFGRGMLYKGLLSDEAQTKEWWLNSVAFTGFLDGYEGRSNRYDEEKGAPRLMGKDPLQILSDLPILLAEEEEPSPEHKRHVDDITDQLVQSVLGPNSPVNNTYTTQYDLGKAARSNPKI